MQQKSKQDDGGNELMYGIKLVANKKMSGVMTRELRPGERGMTWKQIVESRAKQAGKVTPMHAIGNRMTKPGRLPDRKRLPGIPRARDVPGTSIHAADRVAEAALNDGRRNVQNRKGIQSFKKGGRVPKTMVAKVHKGEFVLPVGVPPTPRQQKAVRRAK